MGENMLWWVININGLGHIEIGLKEKREVWVLK